MRPTDEHRDPLQRVVETARDELRRWTDATDRDPGIAIVELLAFVADALSSYADAIAEESYLGSRARFENVRVEVDGQPWRRMTSLDESGPDDQHFVVTRTDGGPTVIEFGDGVHGRRPPAGDGLRVSYRSGSRYASVTMQQGRVELDTDWSDPAEPGPQGDDGSGSGSAKGAPPDP